MCMSHWTAAFQDILSVRRRTLCGRGGGGNIRKKKPFGPPSAGRMRWLATVFVLFSKVRSASWIIFWKKNTIHVVIWWGFYVRKNTITAFSSSSSQENKLTSKYERIHVGINWVCLKSKLFFASMSILRFPSSHVWAFFLPPAVFFCRNGRPQTNRKKGRCELHSRTQLYLLRIPAHAKKKSAQRRFRQLTTTALLSFFSGKGNGRGKWFFFGGGGPVLKDPPPHFRVARVSSHKTREKKKWRRRRG